MFRRGTIEIVGALIALFSQSGCLSEPRQIVISAVPCELNSKGVEFTLAQAFARKFDSGSIRIEVAGGWEPSPPWTSIQLSDDRRVKVAIELFSEDGQRYRSSVLGSAGGTLNARFEPEIPKRASIKMVRITADAPLMCERITWYDFNAE